MLPDAIYCLPPTDRRIGKTRIVRKIGACGGGLMMLVTCYLFALVCPRPGRIGKTRILRKIGASGGGLMMLHFIALYFLCIRCVTRCKKIWKKEQTSKIRNQDKNLNQKAALHIVPCTTNKHSLVSLHSSSWSHPHAPLNHVIVECGKI